MLKFKRKYIGGSLKNEIETFENANWLDYRKHFDYYWSDIIAIYNSWHQILTYLKYLSIFLLIFSTNNLLLSTIFISVSIILHIISQHIASIIYKKYANYEYGLSIIKSEINKKYKK